VYKDNVEFYSTAEPAIDLTAPSFLMLAWRMAGQPAETSNQGSTRQPGATR
jgi:hypothetical protein